jgi:type VI secretion system protein ImpJ
MARYPQYRKVVWSEGMFLIPHHFQQWDRYHENLLNFRLRPITPFGWGVTELVLNSERLADGSFILETFRGIFPSGTAINVPDVDDTPASRIVEPRHFAPSRNSLDVYLAIPVERPNAANCRLEDSGGTNETRYTREFVSIPDLNTGTNEQEIAAAKKNLRILFADESSDGYERLKIAELTRTADDAIALNEEYIPPCLVISASQRLMNTIEGIFSRLSAKHRELSGQCRQDEKGRLYEFGVADITTLSILHTINSYRPLLNHVQRIKQIHPEEVFRIILQLAGELTVYVLDIDSGNLPEYKHDGLSYSFGVISRQIQDILDRIKLFTRYIPIELEGPDDEGIRMARIQERLLEPESPYRFYMAFRADVPEQNLIDKIYSLVKISHSRNDTIVLRDYALRSNIGLQYSSVLPSAIPIKKPGYCYFRLEERKDLWEKVQGTKTLAIYVPPGDFPELKVEFMAVVE